MLRLRGQALTFDDVLLVPRHSQVAPTAADVSSPLTPGVRLNIPLISAAMDTVTGVDMALGMAGLGGIGVLHRNASIQDQAQMVRTVKRFESGVVRDPVTIQDTATVADLRSKTRALKVSGMPVLNADGDLVGIVTSRDVRGLSEKAAAKTPVSQVMTGGDRLVTVRGGASAKEVSSLMHEHRIEKVLVQDEAGRLVGLITQRDMERGRRSPLATLDGEGRRVVAAAVGVGEALQRAEALVEAGVDLLVVDSAHGHAQQVLDAVAELHREFPQHGLIAGNVATGEGAKALAEAGAQAIKVGVGPGSICTTRIVTGAGVPQITAISEVAEALDGSGVTLISDGGLRYSGDITKALAAGAHCVMVGNLLAGTAEAPGETILYQGRTYKSYRGMGSLGVMTSPQARDRYGDTGGEASSKLVPEGVEGRVPYSGPLAEVIAQLVGGLRQGMGYLGAADVASLHASAEFVTISAAGYGESHVHQVSVTREAPNYHSSV